MRHPFTPAELTLFLHDFCRGGLHLAYGTLPGSPDPVLAAAGHFDRLAAACLPPFPGAGPYHLPESPFASPPSLGPGGIPYPGTDEVLRGLASYLVLWAHVRRSGAAAFLLPLDHEMKRLAVETADVLVPNRIT